MNDHASRPATVEELQALALKPLIDLMAESLATGDDLRAVLHKWWRAPKVSV